MEKQSMISEILLGIVLIMALIFTINAQVFTLNEVSGVSMEPTLHTGDIVLVNKFAKFDRFDLVIFEKDEENNFIKRIIGVPGDHIQYDEDVLYINGEPYEEPYLDEAKKHLMSGTLTEDFTLQSYTGYEVIPEGYYFVLGDNRRNSIDSRIIGLIPEEKLVGTTNFIVQPQERFGKIK